MANVCRTIVALGVFVGMAGWIPTASAVGVSVESATAEQKKSAQDHFIEAKKLFDDKQFEKALEGFHASYDVVVSPNSHLMIARTLRELDRIVEAFAEYQRVVEEAEAAASKDDKYANAASAARKELEELRARVGLVTVQVSGGPKDTQVFINDVLLERDKWGKEMPVRAGVITLSAKAPGKPEHREDVKVEAGSMTHDLDLNTIWPPPPSPVGPVVEENEVKRVDGSDKRTWAYIAGGVGAAGVVTFGVFGVMARSKYNSLNDDCPNGVCPTDRSGDIDAGRRNQTIANVGLIVGVVGLGTGTALYLMSDDKGQEQPTTQVGLGPGSVTVRGTF